MKPASSRHRRQFVAGLLALPLSVLPFVAYGTLTAEGRLVRDRVAVALNPPKLPTLSAATTATIRRNVPRYENRVMVLAYHGIGSSDAEGGFVISPQRFGEHLAALRAAGMQTVTAAEVAASLSGKKPLPSNAVMISFDDGRADAMLFADPLLEQAQMTATMFVITGAAEHPGVYYASWDALASYAKSGRWDLQSHTSRLHFEQRVGKGVTLPALTTLAEDETIDEYRARVRSDLSAAASSIEAATGHRPVAFAYPFGAYGADRTNHPEIRHVLRAEVARYHTLAFHQDEQDSVPLVAGSQDRLGLRRLEVEDWSGPALIRRIAEAERRSREAPSSSSPNKTPAPPPTSPFVGTSLGRVLPTPKRVTTPAPENPSLPLPDVPDLKSTPTNCDITSSAISIDSLDCAGGPTR